MGCCGDGMLVDVAATPYSAAGVGISPRIDAGVCGGEVGMMGGVCGVGTSPDVSSTAFATGCDGLGPVDGAVNTIDLIPSNNSFSASISFTIPC